jgi:hypothetical protein
MAISPVYTVVAKIAPNAMKTPARTLKTNVVRESADIFLMPSALE